MLLLDFNWLQLLQPQWYIENGGLWFIVLVIFSETGLFAGFFLPGDSLLFVAGIYSTDLFDGAFHFSTGLPIIDMLLLGAIIALAGIVGNQVGYWFGKKSGPFLFDRKDSFLFRKKYLYQAKEFYEKHGGGAIIMARFLPIVRTFAPIVAGIVQMEKKKFFFFNIVGSLLWVYSMLIGGHYLQKIILNEFGFDLKKHLEVIVIGIVLITTAPVLMKILFNKKKKVEHGK
jgi:membrane-associated protein